MSAGANGLWWLVVDFDGTLAENIWSPDRAGRAIGSPIWDNIDKLHGMKYEGWRILIHTARPWADYDAIEKWLRNLCVPFDRIVCGKPLAAAYIDDRAVNAASADWSPPEVKSNET